MARVLACVCCGHWRVEQIVLNGRQRLRVTSRGFIVGYARSPSEVVRLLERDGGPGLAQFGPC